MFGAAQTEAQRELHSQNGTCCGAAPVRREGLKSQRRPPFLANMRTASRFSSIGEICVCFPQVRLSASQSHLCLERGPRQIAKRHEFGRAGTPRGCSLALAPATTMVPARNTRRGASRIPCRHCFHRRFPWCSATRFDRTILHVVPRDEYAISGTDTQPASRERVRHSRHLRRLPCAADVRGWPHATRSGHYRSLGASARRTRHARKIRKSTPATGTEDLEGTQGERLRRVQELSHHCRDGNQPAIFHRGERRRRDFLSKHAPVTGAQPDLYRLPQGSGTYAAQGLLSGLEAIHIAPLMGARFRRAARRTKWA